MGSERVKNPSRAKWCATWRKTNDMKRTYKLQHPDTAAEISVTAKFCKGYPDRLDPGEPDSAEIQAVLHGEGTDITDDLTDEQLFEIESAWLQAWYDEESAHIDDEI